MVQTVFTKILNATISPGRIRCSLLKRYRGVSLVPAAVLSLATLASSSLTNASGPAECTRGYAVERGTTRSVETRRIELEIPDESPSFHFHVHRQKEGSCRWTASVQHTSSQVPPMKGVRIVGVPLGKNIFDDEHDEIDFGLGEGEHRFQVLVEHSCEGTEIHLDVYPKNDTPVVFHRHEFSRNAESLALTLWVRPPPLRKVEPQ